MRLTKKMPVISLHLPWLTAAPLLFLSELRAQAQVWLAPLRPIWKRVCHQVLENLH